MNQQQSASGYRVAYAVDDAVVKRFLERASLYKVLGWMQLVACGLSAVVGIFESSFSATIAAFLMGTTGVLCLITYSGYQKSAWLRTLEVRLDDLGRSNSGSREPTHADDVPVA